MTTRQHVVITALVALVVLVIAYQSVDKLPTKRIAGISQRLAIRRYAVVASALRRESREARRVKVQDAAVASFSTGCYAALFVKSVHPPGDHVSYLVIAPEASLRFRYSGGEAGAWQHAHPGIPPPWWLSGHYTILLETTSS